MWLDDESGNVNKQQQYVLRTVEERNVRFIRLWFTDVLGILKSVAITAPELAPAFAEGIGFDGSAIDGFARVQEADMLVLPDADTFQLLPWRPTTDGVARMFCDVATPDGEPFEADSRAILKSQLDRANDLGYTLYVHPEMEFYLFADADDPTPLDRGSYFDMTPLDVQHDFRRQTIDMLERTGISVEYSHHEVGPSQHEIDLRATDALAMADNIMTFRLIVKEVALQRGIHATFMPKPLQEEWGSAMHLYLSLFDADDDNVFFDADDELGMSSTAKAFTAGVLHHARGMTAITNQWVNSYKRLVPGFEAPVHVSWGQSNRSALVRIPQARPNKKSAARIEYRAPDPACNPYLTFAVLLAAGLDGVEQERELPPETSDNIYEMSAAQRSEAGIESLPTDLGEAVAAMEACSLVQGVLGERVTSYFLANKKREWNGYNRQVTPFELDQYLPIL